MPQRYLFFLLFSFSLLDLEGQSMAETFRSKHFFQDCTPTYHTIDTTGCLLYKSPGGQVYTSPGTYFDTLVNSGGCDSIITINLDFTEIDTSIIQDGSILIANEKRANFYQWIDCETGAWIGGANMDQYQVIWDGSYALLMHLGACVDTSGCHQLVLSHLDEESREQQVLPYPNPCDAFFRCDVRTSSDLSLFDITGKKVLVISSYRGRKVDIHSLPAGLYFLRIKGPDGLISRKLLVE